VPVVAANALVVVAALIAGRTGDVRRAERA
jgi:hypothetical protein